MKDLTDIEYALLAAELRQSIEENGLLRAIQLLEEPKRSHARKLIKRALKAWGETA
jgi:hypothetical protein